MNDCTEPDRASCPRMCLNFCNKEEEAKAEAMKQICAGIDEFNRTNKHGAKAYYPSHIELVQPMTKPTCTSCGSPMAAKRRAIAKKILVLRELNPLFTMRDVCDVLDYLLDQTGKCKRK